MTAQSIMICNTLMVTDEEGNLSTYAYDYRNSKTFPDIPGDNGKTGYMSGTISIVQNSSYNKYNSQNQFIAYGFECSFSMKWLKDPIYTMKDYFTFCADNAYTEDDSSFTLTTDVRYQDPNIEYTTYSRPGTKSYKNGWPIFTINLPTSSSLPTGSVLYSNYRMSARARLYAIDNFRIRMAYAHKQLVPGDLSVSISTSGPSISFSGTSHREYQTPNFDVGFVA